MAEGKRGRWLLITLVVLLLGGLACCCGCAGLWHFLPQILIASFTEDQPISAPATPPDPEVAARLQQSFASGGPVAIQPGELVQLAGPSEKLSAFWVGIDPTDTLSLVLSIEVEEGRWFNLRSAGSIEVEHGWFTHFTVDELVAGGWDVGQYVVGQELAQQANQSLANERAKDPRVAEAMDQVERVWIGDGALNVQLFPGGWEKWQALREGGF